MYYVPNRTTVEAVCPGASGPTAIEAGSKLLPMPDADGIVAMAAAALGLAD